MKMNPFNLEAAKRGDRIITRNGQEAKFIAHVPEARSDHRVIALIGTSDVPGGYCENGMYVPHHSNDADLFMAPPPMRSLNGYEYPEPLKEAPPANTMYFAASPGGSVKAVRLTWRGTMLDRRLLKLGLAHLTMEAAHQHGNAVILAGGGEL